LTEPAPHARVDLQSVLEGPLTIAADAGSAQPEPLGDQRRAARAERTGPASRVSAKLALVRWEHVDLSSRTSMGPIALHAQVLPMSRVPPSDAAALAGACAAHHKYNPSRAWDTWGARSPLALAFPQRSAHRRVPARWRVTCSCMVCFPRRPSCGSV
jgi:hypothetical protein